LHEHNKESTLCGATIATDSEEFFESIPAFSLGGFNLEKLVRVVHIACSLYLVLTQSAKCLESFIELALLHVPSTVVSS
jgi:hypothetical protein